jgi:hypothetical protein
MVPDDWRQGEDLPREDQSEREAAIAQAQQLLAGPDVRVPTSTLQGLISALRTSVRVIEAILQEGSTQLAAQDGDHARE